MNIKTSFAAILLSVGVILPAAAQRCDERFTQQTLAFPRERMQLEDEQVLLFNGRFFVCPRENSMTAFCYPPAFDAPLKGNYEFHINVTENSTGQLIRDDVGLAWKQRNLDPLSCNLRSNYHWVMVTQDEVWMPNLYTRTGIFLKDKGNKHINFGMKTGTSVSSKVDEVYLWMEIENHDTQELSLTLTPIHQAPNLGDALNGTVVGAETRTNEIKVNTPFEIASEQVSITVSSDIEEYSEKGFVLTIPAGGVVKRYFAIRFNMLRNETKPPVVQKDIAQRFEQSQKDVQQKLEWVSTRLPMIRTGNAKIDALYYRCIYTVMLCRYERDDFLVNPFWAVGTWLSTISWDNVFASDMLAMLDPASLREAVNVDFREGKMKYTWITWRGVNQDIPHIYLPEPFNLKIMIENYIKNTGDKSIFNDMAGDATVYQWMKRWAYELHDTYGGRPDGLIDIGPSAEKLTEIRTDGYNHIVAIISIMTADLYQWLARWSADMNDPKEGEKFTKWAVLLKKSIEEKLWNEEKGWYDNLYPDGSKATVWSYLLFDMFESRDVVDAAKMMRVMSHIREGVFLGQYGFYSIARNDKTHWDRIDADWGGGGQYCGMPFRIAKNMVKSGYSTGGWDLLNRLAGYTDYLPYITQNPRTDKPFNDLLTSMPIEVSAGAGVEAILTAVFGISKSIDGILTIEPITFRDLGVAEMKGLHYRGHTYDIKMEEKTFTVWQDGALKVTLPYGNRMKF